MLMNIASLLGDIPQDLLDTANATDATPATESESPRPPSRAERRGSKRATHTIATAQRITRVSGVVLGYC